MMRNHAGLLLLPPPPPRLPLHSSQKTRRATTTGPQLSLTRKTTASSSSSELCSCGVRHPNEGRVVRGHLLFPCYRVSSQELSSRGAPA